MRVSVKLKRRVLEAWKRAFGEFLALPLVVVIGFVVMAVLIYIADDAWSRGHVPLGFGWLGALLGDNAALSGLLTTVASSIITVTSITFSLLLVALQQGSSALTTQVSDQFLMRRTNQFYFGFFVGLSVYVLLSLLTVSKTHRPVFGTSVAMILTTVALCMIVVMIYNTIDQMRPVQIVRAIHQHVLGARQHELQLLARTRRGPRLTWPVAATIASTNTGYVVELKDQPLREALDALCPAAIEVQLTVALGRYVAFRDPLVTLRLRPGATLDAATREKVEAAITGAIVFNDARALRRDPEYGLYQLATISWTSISTAKSNPGPGTAVIQSLRDIIARWGAAFAEVAEDPTAPIVYPDVTPDAAINALETIILATSESIQAQTLTDALRTVTILLDRAPAPYADRLADVVRRALSGLGEHVLTRDLETALHDLEAALTRRGFSDMSEALHDATARFATTLGALNSRSTRVPGA